MLKLKWQLAISWHVRRQHLDKRLPRPKLLPLTSELCGLHAQVMSSAELTALCRIDGLKPGDISKALWTDRTLIKAWAMRNTLHLLPADEYGRWLRVFGSYSWLYGERLLKYLGVTAEQLEQITEACGTATRGRLLTRQQLAEEIVRLTGHHHAREKLLMGWGMLLKPASYRGYLCFGPNAGQNAQFTNPEIPVHQESVDAFVTHKYFSAYGPATEHDFARWVWGSRRQARTMMASLGDELAEVDIEGVKAWMLRRDFPKASKAEPVKTVRLLPAFDQYVFASALRSARLMPGDFHSRIYKTQGWFAPVLLVDGRMEGVWNFTRKGKSLQVTVEPFVKAAQRVRRAAEEEAERIAAYMDRTLDLRWTS